MEKIILVPNEMGDIVTLLREGARYKEKYFKSQIEIGRLEEIICMRTDFTGDPPYVGIDGLCLALNETCDKADRYDSCKN